MPPSTEHNTFYWATCEGWWHYILTYIIIHTLPRVWAHDSPVFQRMFLDSGVRLVENKNRFCSSTPSCVHVFYLLSSLDLTLCSTSLLSFQLQILRFCFPHFALLLLKLYNLFIVYTRHTPPLLKSRGDGKTLRSQVLYRCLNDNI